MKTRKQYLEEFDKSAPQLDIMAIELHKSFRKGLSRVIDEIVDSVPDSKMAAHSDFDEVKQGFDGAVERITQWKDKMKQ